MSSSFKGAVAQLVERLTGVQRVASQSFTVLCPWARHFMLVQPRKKIC